MTVPGILMRAALLVALALAAAGCNLDRITPTPIPQPTAAFMPPAEPGADPFLQATAALGSPNPNCPATPPGWVAYVVEPGDSLLLLASQTDSTTEELVAGNCLTDANSIALGSTLYLPRTPVVTP